MRGRPRTGVKGGPTRKFIALGLVDRGIARDDYPVLNLAGQEIGIINSGSAAPFLKNNIAFALVATQAAATSEDGVAHVRQH